MDIIPVPLEVSEVRGELVLPSTATVFAANAEGTARYFAELVNQTRDASFAPGDATSSQIHFEIAPAVDAVSEGYALEISPDRVVVSASHESGLFYGAITLWQMIANGSSDAIRLPAVTIVDSPRFAWRGLMLDSARHYQSPEFIKRFIDAMAVHKLNVLHWHLTDDQAWRLEIKKYPKLTTVGAWRVPAGEGPARDIDPQTNQPRLYGGFYTQDDVREIVAHARQRHITIVPEIEMSGHASAPIAAYPHLGVPPPDESRVTSHPSRPPSDWGVYSNLYNANDATFAFLEDVLTEVIELFPSEYIHVGGDEAAKDQWRASPTVQARIRELGLRDEHHLQSYFIQRIEKFLNSKQRRLIGWDEILEGGLAPNATVMSWRGIDGAVAAAKAGHDTVLSPHPTLYFDHRPSAAPVPGRGRIVTIEDVYAFDPAPAQLTHEQRKHVLGVQANVWTEHIRTEARVEYMTFPKAAALAEIAWSAPDRINWGDFSRRLPAQLARYRGLGIGFAEPTEQPKLTTRFASHDLQLCSEHIALSLEDDAPTNGPRAAFLVDIMNPCWKLPNADLTQVLRLSASVGQVPFNFQIGDDIKKIELHRPRSAEGELEVRLGCEGELLASLPLAPAAGSSAVTQLPATLLPSRPGRHELCLRFTRTKIDPIWVIHSFELNPVPAKLAE